MECVPNFGIIKDVVFHTDVYYFVCEVLVTTCFSHHFHAYEVSKHTPTQYIICKQTELYDYSVLSAYELSDKLYVSLKYELPDNVSSSF